MEIRPFGQEPMSLKEAADLEPRALAHLGDAVFHLFEREREIRSSSSAKQMHARARVKATLQSSLLEKVKPALIQEELEIVRRARNVKAPGPRKGGQAAYRRATAFEALLGYLYLTDRERLKAVLALTLDTDDACVSETELKP